MNQLNARFSMPAPIGHPHYNLNGEGGRPPKHTDEYIENEANLLEEWIKKSDSLYLQDFVLSRDYGPQRLSEWAKRNERFEEVYARAKYMQERKLMEGGLSRKFDSSFCKFTMQNVCKWSDKQTVVHENNTQAIAPEANNTSKDLVNDKSSS